MAKKIVVIDDEKDFSFFVKHNFIANGGYSVICVNDPLKAFDTVRREIPDVIILDIIMPKKSGLQVLEAIKDDPKTVSIPVILLTALGDEEARLKANQLYCEDYLTKPVSLETLRTKVESVLARKAAQGK
jgi:DNA-binding response OmpR family regulator